MKRNLKINFIILVIVAILLPITYSYAIGKVNKAERENSFFEITQLEVCKNEKIEMVIYFDKVNYEKFEFSLQSSNNIENVELSGESSDMEIEKNNNEIAIEIDKAKTNVDQITLYYQVPETAHVNDIIRFTATVTKIQYNENEVVDRSQKDETIVEADKTIIEADGATIQTNETINETDETTENNTVIAGTTEIEKQTVEVQVKVVENKENQNSNQSEDNKQEDNKQLIGKEENKKQEVNEKSANNKETSNFSTRQVSQSSSQNVTAVTYNGSDNNYLSALSIEDYALNKDFSKDNSTYFITAKDGADSLDINMQAEEESAIICVYGNEDLQVGINKILISVTAENGNVRNYRIYVTKNA